MTERENFEKWLQRYDPDQSLTLASEFPYYASYVTCMIVAAWQAALSTRKQHGFGIVDKYGKSRFSYGLFGTKEQAESECYYMNEPVKNVTPILGSPFRVVELFYEDSES